MKFTVFVFSLAIFALLAERYEATIEDVAREMPEEISKVLTAGLQLPHQEIFSHNYDEDDDDQGLGNLTLKYSWSATPALNRATIVKKFMDNSVVSVIFTHAILDMAPAGDIEWQIWIKNGENERINHNYRGSFTSTKISMTSLTLQAFYAALTKSLTVNIIGDPPLSAYTIHTNWEETIPEGYGKNKIERKMFQYFHNHFENEQVTEFCFRAIHDKTPELVKKLDASFKAK